MASSTSIDDLSPAIESEQQWMLELDSGLQLVGKVSEQIHTSDGRLSYFNFIGATELRNNNKPIEGQGQAQHPHGFSSPIGRMEGINRHLWQLSENELLAAGFIEGQKLDFTFHSGIRVSGTLLNIHRREQINLIATFKECTVTDASGRLLYKPEWGGFDMAVGSEVRKLVAL